MQTKVCFVAGTKVHTLGGLKNIEDVRQGELVLTRAEGDGTANTSPVYKPVLATFVTHPDALYHLTLQTNAGDEETLSTTGNHPFWRVESLAFVHAETLLPGDRLALPEGRTARVISLRREQAPTGKPFTTYNFGVEDTHT